MARPRLDTVKYYRLIVKPGGSPRSLHRLRAEKALGKPLPVGAIVHHADGSRGDHAPLVICQDKAYHNLLHRRMRVKAAGGDPNTERLCSYCKVPKPFSAFYAAKTQMSGFTSACKSCLYEHKMKNRNKASHVSL